VNGQLSPDEFIRAGDKLTQVCSGWKWMPSSNPAYLSKYLPETKQYLILEKILCKKRISVLPTGTEEKIEGEDGEELVILHSNEEKE
jgi:ubiquitin-like-conjugating enzyme ATG3